MLRSFLTRFPNSRIGFVLLIPCLLVCLACATPFPVENLEKDMTAEAVRENFGAPEATRGAGSSWTYVDEQQAWFITVMSSTFFLVHCAITTAATMPFGAEHWCSALMPTVEEGQVVLHFEDERLARWEVIEPVPVVSSGYVPLGASFQGFQGIDMQHHQKGHKHHHGHGC